MVRSPRRTAACLVLALGIFAPAATSHAYQMTNRWKSDNTASPDDPFATIVTRGVPINLTWSLVPDGTDLDEANNEPDTPSNMINFLDTHFGNSGATLADRPWFSLFSSSFERWDELSGVRFTYEPNDDGAAHNGLSSSLGVLGTRGDVRIGGHSIDGQTGGNVLANNDVPVLGGDMIIDTDNINSFTLPDNNFRRFRNVLMHELGHALGILHPDSSDAAILMEPTLNTSFDGPQFDDILTIHRFYGDRYEEDGGNDTASNATALGTVTDSVAIAIGTDADGTVVAADETDFVSVDDDSDPDFYSFTVTESLSVSLVLTPKGPSYMEGRERGPQTLFETSSLSDLTLTLFEADGSSIIAEADLNGLGESELLSDLVLGPDTYFARITGDANLPQLYRLDISGSTIPEPNTLGLLICGALSAAVRRRQSACRTPSR